jgi:hypothetical protein
MDNTNVEEEEGEEEEWEEEEESFYFVDSFVLISTFLILNKCYLFSLHCVTHRQKTKHVPSNKLVFSQYVCLHTH